MIPVKMLRLCRICLLLPLLLLGIQRSSAQGSNIQISINNFYYNCTTGNLTVVYRLHNIDPWYTYNLQMRYGTITGTQTDGPYTSAESVEVRTWSGPYTPGQPFRIWAEGYWNNGSPYTYYDYYPNILVPAAPVVSNNGASVLCNGETTTLTASGSGGAITWSNGATGNTITVSTPGTYTATEVNGCGTSAASNAIVITGGSVPAAPTIQLSGQSLLCNGATASLVIPGGGATHWYRNGSLVASNSGNLNVSTAGSYTAAMESACGISAASSPVVITTDNTPSGPSVTPAGSQLLCNGAATTLSASGSNITWSNGATGNAVNVTVAGTYYAVDANACGNSPASNAVLITTGNCPTPSPGTSFFICPTALKTLDAGAGYEYYLWSNGATTRTISVGPGNYSVTVTKEGCTATSSAVTVLYYSVNAPLINTSGSTVFCAGSSVTLSAAGGTAWLWSNGATTSSIVVSTPGSFNVTMTDGNGCQATSAPVTVTVNDGPSTSVSGSATVCKNGASPSVTFTAVGGTPPYTFQYIVNSGSVQFITTSGGNSVSVPAPTGTAGTFVYQLVGVQESSSTHCIANASGSATITIRELPTATMTGNATVCHNGTMPIITFTGSGGTAPYRFTYRINGGGLRTVQPGSGSVVQLPHPTNVTGTFVYELLSVKETTGFGCEAVVTGTVSIVVRELPEATIAGNATVCRNSASPVITFTGSTGTQPYTFEYRINNGAIQSVATTSGNTATVNVPTNTAGTFVYSLVSVGENGGCGNPVSGEATVVVRALPDATIAGSTTVCQNGTQPQLVFTGSTGTAPYTFQYRINNGALLTATTSSGNSVSVNVPTGSAGTFTYSLVSVKESGTGTCEQSVSGSVSVIVNPQPVVAVIAAPNTHLCNGETGSISVFNWVAGNTYTWYRNGVLFTTTTSQSITVTLAGAYTVMVTTPEGCSASGNSNMINITNGTVATPVITGKLKVCPDGKTMLVVNGEHDFESWGWMLMPEEKTIGNGRSFSAAAGQYRVRVMREGCYDYANTIVTADDTEYPAGQLVISPQTIPYGGKATFMANVTGAASFEWDLGDNRKVVTLSNKMTQNYFVRDDSVRVKVRAISERNCIADFTAAFKVGPPGEHVIIDRSWIGNLKDWNLFPNPFHDNLKLSVILKRNETVRIDMFTADGMWVKGWHKAGRKGENLFQLEGVETLAANVVFIITAIYNGEKHAGRIYKY